ncbi:glycerol-3-phosphate acyltransferase 1, mitochondrial [Nilaparvata lugens]|uniref:glycerol-3-phosphate acyltransferase 1, mitochondrial n=1 Tax=Nilaparvata lugens TaxID=108931 RepID=UPI00193D78C7|nr:glycerol-3-phosphate acyltransferase 1, mitochondrial [Nilaparvata lugens]
MVGMRQECISNCGDPWILVDPVVPCTVAPGVTMAQFAHTNTAIYPSITMESLLRKSCSVINVLRGESLDSCPRGVLSKVFPQLTQAFTFKKFPFPYIYDTVLKDERLVEVVKTSAEQLVEDGDATPEQKTKFYKRQQERAVRLLSNLRSTFSDIILRLASWVMTKVFSKTFSGVVVHPAHLEMLKKASGSGLPLIFVPLHRSHLDYIVITYILCNNNIRSPLVAAGENLRIPVFGWLLRGLGAFFIKRRIDPVQGRKDILYRAVLHTYMTESLRAGHNFEFFIEGGRTRSGKPCMPKGGLLSVFVDAYLDGTIEDALLIPVSINYDKLVDGNFVREQLGTPKQMETFGNAISAIWRALTSHYGIMRVDFNQPFSLRELVKSFQTRLSAEFSKQNGNQKKVLHSVPSSASLYGTDVVAEEQRQLVDCIARHIVYGKLFTILLECAWLQCCKLCIFIIDILGPGLVKRERDGGKISVYPVTMLPNVIELSYYSNSVLPHFSLDSIVATTIKSFVAKGQRSIPQDSLLENSLLLCNILQYEFIFTKTCQNLENALLDTINHFQEKEILIVEQENLTEDQTWSKRIAARFEYDDDDTDEGERPQFRQPPYQINESSETYHFYSQLLRPFIDVYIISATNLHRFVSQVIPERDHIKDVISDINTQLQTGSIECGESVSVDTIRNSLKLFEKWNVLECHTQDKTKVYYLNKLYDNEQSLEKITNRLLQFSAIRENCT